MQKINMTKKLLTKEYIQTKKSVYKIAEEFNFSSSTVHRYLKKFNIKTRTKSEAQRADLNHNYTDGSSLKVNNCIDCGKKLSKHSYWHKTKRCIYCGNKIMAQKAKGRKRPDLSEINRKRTGKNNPNYIDGNSNFPYPLEFNKSLKEQIRKRDNYTCQNCSMTEEEHIIVYGYNLTIHHIDYDKGNCEEDNLISLCFGCNIRANYNRKYWIELFHNKIKV